MIERFISELSPDYNPERLIAIRSEISPRFHEALFWETGLSPLSRYVIDFEKMFREAFTFLKYRGTLRSIRLALSWVGVQNPRFVRLSLTEYEIDPGFVPDSLRVQAIKIALQESVQARGRLVRIFHGDFEVRF